MKLVIFGLTISSSWGNGHATLWRGLCRAMAERGHRVVFYERDVSYYACHRDVHEVPGGGRLRLYGQWSEVAGEAERELHEADVGMVTSYCPDGIAATELVLGSKARIRTFYDLDTPVTLANLERGVELSYIHPRGHGDFDLVLSYTGGRALKELQEKLGARRVEALYGSVDPQVHCPAEARPQYRADLSYLGTYAEDRQQMLDELLVQPSRHLPDRRFVIGGAQYPAHFPWTRNIYFVRHLPPQEHPAFFCSSRLTLNVTRRSMREMGHCPSGRLFEAAACGTAVISDWWEGLEGFFTPGSEILVARDSLDAVDAIERSDSELRRIAAAARQRTLDEHTAGHRVMQLEKILESVGGEGRPRRNSTLASS